MRRMQLVEIEDLESCPRVLRDGGTDWLAFMANVTRAFDAVAPKIRAALDRTGTDRVLDLCSGGGGPWPTLERTLSRERPVFVELSDRYPNLEALAAFRDRTNGRCGFRAESIDATNVPADLDGVRTMFNCFHHFPEPMARSILADAVRKRRAIAVFEGVDSRLLPLLGMPVQVLVVLLLTPLVRPFRWSRLLFTYPLPLIPLLILFDGAVSMLRIYSPEELRQLVATVPGQESFEWDIGVTPVRGSPLGLTHLVGMPRG